MSPFRFRHSYRYFAVPSATLRAQRGFTVAELLVVVIILAVVASIALPDLRSSDSGKTELAAAEVAEALRFARSEALRTGDTHGVQVDEATGRFLARRVNLSTVPFSTDVILRHPVSKQPYDFNVGGPGPTAGVSTNVNFKFVGNRRENDLLFTAEGVPVYIDTGAGTVIHLDQGLVSLKLGAQKSTVKVAPLTGRVTVQ